MKDYFTIISDPDQPQGIASLFDAEGAIVGNVELGKDDLRWLDTLPAQIRLHPMDAIMFEMFMAGWQAHQKGLH